MSLYNGPPRPGARGGRGEFSWDNVKADKDREYYIGHSVKATTGRWAKGKDVFWYTKGKGDGGVAQEELEAVQAREREIMAEALGLKPKAAPKQLKQPSLEKHEVDKLLSGGSVDADGAATIAEADKTKGLGFDSKSAVAVREEVHEVLPGTGYPAPPGMASRQGAAAAGDRLMTAEQLMRLAEADVKAAGKAERKDKKRKKEKKADKKKKEKHKKHKKHKRRSSSSSSSSSDSEQEEQRGGGHRLMRRGPVQQALQQPEEQLRQHNHHNHHHHQQQQQQQQRPAEYGGYGRAGGEMRPAQRQQVQRPAEHADIARSSRDLRPPAQHQRHPQSGRRFSSRSRSPVATDRHHHHSRSPSGAHRQHSRSPGRDRHERARQPRTQDRSPSDSRPPARGTAEGQHHDRSPSGYNSRGQPTRSQRRSRSPIRSRQPRSSSPGARGRQYMSNSPDPELQRHSRSPAAARHGRHRSRSPGKHKQQHMSSYR